MKRHTFKMSYKYEGETYIKIYTKFCKYPKKTKLYKNLLYLLDNDSRVIKIEIT